MIFTSDRLFIERHIRHHRTPCLSRKSCFLLYLWKFLRSQLKSNVYRSNDLTNLLITSSSSVSSATTWMALKTITDRILSRGSMKPRCNSRQWCEQGVKKRCRLYLLTNSALVYESQCGGIRGGGVGVAGSQPMSTAVHIT
jgi:hypothetical protein